MRTGAYTALVVLVLALTARGQKQPDSFVLDQSKEFVYIAFDHVGPRKPAFYKDEIPKGLWLRIVNNCRVLIEVPTFDPETGDPGTGVYDEIIMHGRNPEQPESNDDAPKPEPPPEYSSGMAGFDLAAIPPGQSLLFSVPMNHVSPDWDLGVAFIMGGVRASHITNFQVKSTVSFRWSEIPEEYRRSTPPDPSNPAAVIDPAGQAGQVTAPKPQAGAPPK